jgi:cyanate permease
MVALVIPIVAFSIGRPPLRGGQPKAALATAQQTRKHALRDIAFLSIAIAFSLVLFAQVGFIVHLIAFLDPVIGREHAALALSLLTIMAVVGRLLFSAVIDRFDQRLASALSFLSQAVALAVIVNSGNEVVLIVACVVFGFSVGNLITLPSLIVQREFDASSFGVLISLITAITQVTYAFGPGVVGALRDLSGSYTLPFYGCIALQLIAAALIMARGSKVVT